MREKNKRDCQSHKYQITINNPNEFGFTHEEITKILITHFKTIQYFCMVDEKGQTYHTHIFVYFKSRVRFSMIKKYFPQAHIEIARATVSMNIQYLKKDGKWADTTKSETTVKGSFVEWGNRPSDSVGKRDDFTELYNLISQGYSNAEILSINQDYIPMIESINKTRTTLLIDKYQNTRRLDLKVTYIFGKTKTNKTRSVYDTFGDANVYRVTDYAHPFDSYACQNIMVFDEFRSQLPLADMLQYCDIYPIELPARYNNKFACYNEVFIISNWDLKKQYSELHSRDRETWEAFLRRISEVIEFLPDGKRIYHGDALSYINKTDFTPIPK